MRSADAIFHETQNLRQHRLMILLLPGGVFMIVFFAYSMIQQLGFGRPVGDKPMSDVALAIVGPLYMILGGILLWLYFKGQLKTEVRPDGLFVQFYPLHLREKQIPTDGIESCEAITYRAIRDFGGWGIRYGPRGRAYNVSGNRGAYLVFDNGKRLLIGSQKADLLVEAIRSIRR